MYRDILITAVSDEINTALPVNVRPDTLYITNVLRRPWHFETFVYLIKQTSRTAPFHSL